MQVITTCVYSDNILYCLYKTAFKQSKFLFGHTASGSCAAEHRESCQAGNRAALSVMHCAPQSACSLCDQVKTTSVFIFYFLRGLDMYQALYRKWRPQVFSDVVGQPHITTTLMNEVDRKIHSHAYLFTGSRGTGKTTCAKILQKLLTV